MVSIGELQTKAVLAFEDNSAAIAAARKLLPDMKAFCAAADAAPPRQASAGRVSVKAIIPENRAAYRRGHFRFQYRIDGKVVTEAAAIAALAKREVEK